MMEVEIFAMALPANTSFPDYSEGQSTLMLFRFFDVQRRRRLNPLGRRAGKPRERLVVRHRTAIFPNLSVISPHAWDIAVDKTGALEIAKVAGERAEKTVANIRYQDLGGEIGTDFAEPAGEFRLRGDITEQAQAGLLPLIGLAIVGPVLLPQGLGNEMTAAPPRSPDQEFAVVNPFHPLAETADVESGLPPHGDTRALHADQIADQRPFECRWSERQLGQARDLGALEINFDGGGEGRDDFRLVREHGQRRRQAAFEINIVVIEERDNVCFRRLQAEIASASGSQIIGRP